MSSNAIRWALKQRASTPAAQLVLFLLANEADVAGVFRIGDTATFLKRTRLEAPVLQRCLDYLRAQGCLILYGEPAPYGNWREPAPPDPEPLCGTLEFSAALFDQSGAELPE